MIILIILHLKSMICMLISNLGIVLTILLLFCTILFANIIKKDSLSTVMSSKNLEIAECASACALPSHVDLSGDSFPVKLTEKQW